MNEKRRQSLIDTLANQAGCPFISDLHYINPEQMQKVTERLQAISPGDYPLEDWNDALSYLISAPPERSPEAARQRLLDHYKPKGFSPILKFSQGGTSV